MYLDFKVKIPSDSAGITRKKNKGNHVYLTFWNFFLLRNFRKQKAKLTGVAASEREHISCCAESFRSITWMKWLETSSVRTAVCFLIWLCIQSLQRTILVSIILIMHSIIRYSRTGCKSLVTRRFRTSLTVLQKIKASHSWMNPICIVCFSYILHLITVHRRRCENVYVNI